MEIPAWCYVWCENTRNLFTFNKQDRVLNIGWTQHSLLCETPLSPINYGRLDAKSQTWPSFQNTRANKVCIVRQKRHVIGSLLKILQAQWVVVVVKLEAISWFQPTGTGDRWVKRAACSVLPTCRKKCHWVRFEMPPDSDFFLIHSLNTRRSYGKRRRLKKTATKRRNYSEICRQSIVPRLSGSILLSKLVQLGKVRILQK